MYNSATSNSNKTRTYVALVAPGSKIKEGETLLDITINNVVYVVKVTGNGNDDMLHSDHWGKDHSSTDVGKDSEKNYILTKPGVNYVLNVSVGRAKVHVVANIADWTPVNASGEGHVDYGTGDVVTISPTFNESTFTENSSFKLFRLKSTVANKDNSSDWAETKATYEEVSGEGKKWTASPVFYWNTSESFNYRALAKLTFETGTAPDKTYTIDDGSFSKNTTVNQGSDDILWGTTPAHNSIAEGGAIAPRSGAVPISFKHALSKVTFDLVTTGSSDSDPAYVNLTNATIAVSNLYTTGTIQLDNGTITTTSKTVDAISAQACPITKLHTIPQTIGDDAIVTITLSDNTVYKLQLNQCVVTGTTTPITVWEAGKHYEYTITVEKDKVQFRALIKQWEEKEGSGNANLEWD